MKKTKKHPEVDLTEEGAIMISCDIKDDDFDDIEPVNTLGDVGRYAKTFILPISLNAAHQGIGIPSRQSRMHALGI